MEMEMGMWRGVAWRGVAYSGVEWSGVECRRMEYLPIGNPRIGPTPDEEDRMI
jgi:hypothetical protein